MNSRRLLRQRHSPPCEGGVDATSRKYREASIEGADGVVTHKPYSNNAFRNLACERPPRLRRFGGFATFSLWRSHPSFARRGMAFERHIDLSLIHISEPTRQAEISYAVFCLKKKKK